MCINFRKIIQCTKTKSTLNEFLFKLIRPIPKHLDKLVPPKQVFHQHKLVPHLNEFIDPHQNEFFLKNKLIPYLNEFTDLHVSQDLCTKTNYVPVLIFENITLHKTRSDVKK